MDTYECPKCGKDIPINEGVCPHCGYSVLEGVLAGAGEGDPEAQRILGGAYSAGLGVEQSYEEAAKWYRRAAHAGLREAKIMVARIAQELKGQN